MFSILISITSEYFLFIHMKLFIPAFAVHALPQGFVPTASLLYQLHRLAAIGARFISVCHYFSSGKDCFVCP